MSDFRLRFGLWSYAFSLHCAEPTNISHAEDRPHSPLPKRQHPSLLFSPCCLTYTAQYQLLSRIARASPYRRSRQAAGYSAITLPFCILSVAIDEFGTQFGLAMGWVSTVKSQEVFWEAMFVWFYGKVV